MEGKTVEFKEFKAKTVEEAISVASIELGVASTDLEIEVVDDGSKGFLGIGSKPAIIKVKKKESFLDDIQEYSLYTHFGEGVDHEWMLDFVTCFFCIY